MKIKCLPRGLIKSAAMIAGLVLLHAVLIRWAAHRHVAAAILSGGPQTPAADLALAASMMAVRLGLILLLPAVLARDLARYFMLRGAKAPVTACADPADAATTP